MYSLEPFHDGKVRCSCVAQEEPRGVQKYIYGGHVVPCGATLSLYCALLLHFHYFLLFCAVNDSFALHRCCIAIKMVDFPLQEHATGENGASVRITGGPKEPMQQTYLAPGQWDDLDPVAKEGFTVNDQHDMQRMGKKQEFRRNFRFITTVGFTCCVMGTWEILMTSNTQALLAGGSAALFWSLCWCYTGQTFIVLSLAEMSSMAPTAGGQYHWVSEFAPPGSQRLLSYLSGQ